MTGALVAALLLLAGCSDDGDSSSDGSTPTTSASTPEPTAEDGLSVVCDVLTPAERTSLLGLDRGTRLDGPVDLGGQGCFWNDPKRPAAIQLTIVSMSTADWLKGVPSALAALEQSPDLAAEERAALEEMQAEVATLSEDDIDQACELFTRLAEIQGQPTGATTTVQVTRGRPGLSAQHCEGDTFSSVVGASPEIVASEQLQDAYREAVAKVAAAG